MKSMLLISAVALTLAVSMCGQSRFSGKWYVQATAAELGTQPKLQPGTQPRLQPSRQPKQQSGTQPKRQPGTQPKQQPLMHPMR
jgi:hypothetical protein